MFAWRQRLAKAPSKTATFAKDCYDMETLVWRTWGKGLPGESAPDILVKTVERRFGAVDATPEEHEQEFLTNTGRVGPRGEAPVTQYLRKQHAFVFGNSENCQQNLRAVTSGSDISDA